MKTVGLVTLFSLAASAFGQSNYTVPPNSVPLATREQWCSSQETQCPLICLQVGAQTMTTRQNDCEESTLTYNCVCNNGISPNVSEYSLTLPYFLCTEWGNRCVDNCGLDSTCASDCRQNHPCGAQDTSPPNKTIIAASKSAAAAATTKKGGAVYTGFADGPAATDMGAAGHVGLPVVLGINGGLAVIFGSLFLEFALFL